MISLNDLKTISKTPFALALLGVGAAFVAATFVTPGKDWQFHTREPTPLVLFWLGIAIIGLALALSVFQLVLSHRMQAASTTPDNIPLPDTSKVTEKSDSLSTKIGTCEVRIIFGRLQDHHPNDETVLLLPCNEYFDRQCVLDPKGALGAYLARTYPGQLDVFADLVEAQSRAKLGLPQVFQKSESEKEADSFGAGRALLLPDILNTKHSLALVSTTTQRVETGLVGRMSYLFDAISETVRSLARMPRMNEIAMPLLGSGHGGIEPPLALVGLLLAIAETVRLNPGRLKRVTIIVYRESALAAPAVDEDLARRALALVAT